MLLQDDLYRGKDAIHVHKHRKLGKHRTIIKTALPFINAALNLKEVWRIDFGKISCGAASTRAGMVIKVDRANVWLTITSTRRRQEFRICVWAPSSASAVVEVVKAIADCTGHST